MKIIPNYETTSIYFHIVGCIAECILRCGEDNQHVHDVHNGYEEDMDPPSDVNYMDEDE